MGESPNLNSDRGELLESSDEESPDGKCRKTPRTETPDIGEAISVFSHTGSGWIRGHVVDSVLPPRVSVEYKAGISRVLQCRKHLHPNSPNLLFKKKSELLGVNVDFLRKEFLLEIEANFGLQSDPDYDSINKKMLFGQEGRGLGLICPRDGLADCSYVDALHMLQHGLHTCQATIMLSWCWKYTVNTVVDAVVRWCEKTGRSPFGVFVWQCALCCNQYRVEAKKDNREWEPFDNFRDVFERRVCAIGHVLALLAPWSDPLYITRVWCVFELFVAIKGKHQLDIILPQREEKSFEESLQREGMLSVYKLFRTIKIQNAYATAPNDKEHIMRLVDPCSTDYDESDKVAKLNGQVVMRLHEWLVDAAMYHVDIDRLEGVSPAACFNVAELLISASAWFDATRLLEKALCVQQGKANSPVYAKLMMLKGKCCMKKGDFNNAIAVLKQALNRTNIGRTSLSFELHQQIVTCHLEQGHYIDAEIHVAEAYEALEQAGCKVPPKLFHNLGVCYRKYGRQQEAIAVLEKGVQIFEADDTCPEPEYACLLRCTGSCYADQGYYDKAISFYKRSRQVYEATGATRTPEYADLLKRMGIAKGNQHEYKQAMRLYIASRQAFEAIDCSTNPDYAGLLRVMGTSFNKSGDDQQALKLYKEADKIYNAARATGTFLRTDHAHLLKNMGSLHGKLCEYNQASNCFEQAKRAYEAAGATNRLDYAQLLKERALLIIGLSKDPSAIGLLEEAKKVYELIGPSATERTGYAELLEEIGHWHKRLSTGMHSTSLYTEANKVRRAAKRDRNSGEWSFALHKKEDA